MPKNRDNFSEKVKNQIAKRAGWLCSFPSCRAHTVGATEDGQGEINIGIAAHICAAASGGPRYEENMMPEDRASADNGIWLCQSHAKIIDSDVKQFTTPLLREWKKQASTDSMRRVIRNEAVSAPTVITDADLIAHLHAAASKDLDVFRETAKWPSTTVPLTLEVEDFEEPVTTDALARVVTTLEDLILVAGPGMGKTTTLFQIAAGVLGDVSGVPIVVLLNDWATEGSTVLESILQRPAFKGISENDFYKAAAQSGVVLLLDGWNELGAEARNRARVQVNSLKAKLPELGLIVSTRQPRNQALDVPFGGKRVDLLPLNDDQQMKIATAMRGKEGMKLIDEAWRTAGVRELVTIPLYLTALLSLPKGAPFPTTKEEVLRHFVAAHEKETSHAEALYAVVEDFQQDYLDGLATFATRTATTAIANTNARRCISQTAAMLIEHGQIKTGPQPNTVLDVLVSSHMLMRAGDMPGVSFQHQQFQEWYASHSVERRIIAEVDDPKGRVALKADIFNFPEWEEATLFAVERMSRGNAHQRAVCSKAILAAFEVDPILAAEMIFRSTDEVWALISNTIQPLVVRWHAVQKNRPLRFMLTSGRPEFLDLVWPLITDENMQVSLTALRNCKRFRPSILGKDAAKIIKALPQKPREALLDEIASRSGMDGLDLASNIAKDDPNSEVKASVVDALAFRNADRQVVEILRQADEKTFDLVARKGLIDRVNDKDVQQGIESARKRIAAEETSAYVRLRLIVYAEDSEDRSAELVEIVSTMEIDQKHDSERQLVYQARNRYPRAVSDGLLARVRAGSALFYGTDDILASSGLIFEDEGLLTLALDDPTNDTERADAAASVLGPKAVGRMVDRLLELMPSIRTNRAIAETSEGLRRRIAHVPGTSLVTAITERSSKLNSAQIAQLAGLLSRRPDVDSDRGRPFDATAIRAIQELVKDWGKRLLVAKDAQRWQKAEIAILAGYVPDISLLPLIKEMHDDNLRRYHDFCVQAEAEGWGQSDAVSEARHPHMHEYQRAFLAIKAPETTALMQEYLQDEDFGTLAARVLAIQWHVQNEPPKDKPFFSDVDWSDVEAKRAARAVNPEVTCKEAEAIFTTIDQLIATGTTQKQQRLAIALGITALRLPHGQRDSIIRKLIALAPRKGYEIARCDLLLSLVLSGEAIDITDVIAGINETLEAAKTDWSILHQSDGYSLKVWLRLLPFVSKPIDALPVILGLPDAQRDPYFLKEMIRTFSYVPSTEAEEILFRLAEADPRFYALYEWRDTVIRFGTVSSARRLVDLVAKGVLGKDSAIDDYNLVKQLGELMLEHSDLRGHIYMLLKDGASTPGLAMLAGAVAQSPDEEGLLLLVKCEQKGRSFTGFRMIEKVVAEHVPVEGYYNAYSIVPIPATGLRRKLFAMTTNGGSNDVAARWLNKIDNVRDEYGLPEGEPRHPDLASGKSWPII